MKKSIRLGIITFLIGISIFLVTILRASSSTNVTCGSAILPLDDWQFSSFLFAPRDLRIEIQTNAAIDVYVLDEFGIGLWETKGLLKPLWNISSTDYDSSPMVLNARGTYGVLIHSSQNSTVALVNISVYGIEKDLLWVSIALMIVGPVIIVLHSLLFQKSFKKH